MSGGLEVILGNWVVKVFESILVDRLSTCYEIMWRIWLEYLFWSWIFLISSIIVGSVPILSVLKGVAITSPLGTTILKIYKGGWMEVMVEPETRFHFL